MSDGQPKYRVTITCEQRFGQTVADAVRDLNADHLADFAVTWGDQTKIELTTADPQLVTGMHIIPLAGAQVRVEELG